MKSKTKRISIKLSEEEFERLKRLKNSKKTGWKQVLTGEISNKNKERVDENA